MKLRKEIIHLISEATAALVLEAGLMETDYSEEELSEKISRIITEDLLIEDRLNNEVREILSKHSELMDKNNVNYSDMFRVVKSRLVKERGLIL